MKKLAIATIIFITYSVFCFLHNYYYFKIVKSQNCDKLESIIIWNDEYGYKNAKQRYVHKIEESKLVSNSSITSENDNIKYHIDIISEDVNFIYLNGWSFIEKTDTNYDTKIFIILNSGKFKRIFEAKKYIRPDVTKFFESEYDYDYSGFELLIKKKQFPPDDYKIGIYIRANDQIDALKYINTKLNITKAYKNDVNQNEFSVVYDKTQRFNHISFAIQLFLAFVIGYLFYEFCGFYQKLKRPNRIRTLNYAIRCEKPWLFRSVLILFFIIIISCLVTQGAAKLNYYDLLLSQITYNISYIELYIICLIYVFLVFLCWRFIVFFRHAGKLDIEVSSFFARKFSFLRCITYCKSCRRERIYEWLLPLLPVLVLMLTVPKTGILPEMDYWGMLFDVVHQTGISIDIKDWFERANESCPVIPKLVYVVNMILSGGDSRMLSIFSIAMGTVCVFVFWKLVPYRESKTANILIRFVIAVYILTPLAGANWFRGMSGVCWITSNLFFITVILIISKANNSTRPFTIMGAGMLIVLAPLTYISGLIGNMVLIPTILFSNFRRKQKIALGFITVANVSIHLITYSKPNVHPSFTFNISEVILFAVGFIGNGGLYTLEGAQIAGGVGIVISIILSIVFIYKFARKPSYWMPMVAMIIYPLANALAAGVARYGMGSRNYWTSRYANIGGFFWASVAVLIWSLLSQKSRHELAKKAMLGVMAVLCLIASSGYAFQFKYVKHFIDRKPYNHYAMVLTMLGINEAKSSYTIFRSPVNPILLQPSRRKTLMAFKHIPFRRGVEEVFGGQLYGDDLSKVVLRKIAKPAKGELKNLKLIKSNPDYLKTSGWIKCDYADQALAHIDENFQLIGFAVSGFKQSESKQQYNNGNCWVEFHGLALTEKNPKKIATVIKNERKNYWTMIQAENEGWKLIPEGN